jgi:HEAT repeat protein
VEPAHYAELLADPAAFLDNADAAVRRLAVAACGARTDDEDTITRLAHALTNDASARVRAEAAEALGSAPGRLDVLLAATADDESIVREAVATALGEQADAAALPWLITAVTDDPDRLVREAAIAALGAIGDSNAIDVLLWAVAKGAPQLRRRSVVALTVFDGAAVAAALQAAAHDRNPMVREAAEMVVGRPTTWEPLEFSEPLDDPDEA